MDHGVDAVESPLRKVADVALDELDPVAEARDRGLPPPQRVEEADAVPAVDQARHEHAADVAAAARHEHRALAVGRLRRQPVAADLADPGRKLSRVLHLPRGGHPR